MDQKRRNLVLVVMLAALAICSYAAIILKMAPAPARIGAEITGHVLGK